MPTESIDLLTQDELRNIEHKKDELMDHINSLHDELKSSISQRQYDSLDTTLKEIYRTYEMLGDYISTWQRIIDRVKPKAPHRPGFGFPGPEHQTEGWAPPSEYKK
ncbi:MAG: hypothetical protein ACLFTR_01255 [Candidatus Woesearchaeota archaeon]